MKLETFTQQLLRVCAALDAEMTEARIEIYWEHLGDLPDDVFTKACDLALEEFPHHGHVPLIAHFLRYADRVVLDRLFSHINPLDDGESLERLRRWFVAEYDRRRPTGG